MKIIITENQYEFLDKIENDLISYNSKFNPNTKVLVIFKNNPKYSDLENLFEEYGYGFYFSEQNLIIIDGEIFLGDNGLTINDLAFIEAHEVAHILLNHKGGRSSIDEIEADLGAYLILKKHNMSTDRLVDEFYTRHGFEFDERLKDLFKIKKFF